MRIDALSDSSGRFAARSSASVTTDDRRIGRRGFLPTTDTAFASLFVESPQGGMSSAEAPAAATTVALQDPSPTSPARAKMSPQSLVRPHPTFPHPAIQRLKLPRRLSPSPFGRAGKQPQHRDCATCC